MEAKKPNSIKVCHEPPTKHRMNELVRLYVIALKRKRKLVSYQCLIELHLACLCANHHIIYNNKKMLKQRKKTVHANVQNLLVLLGRLCVCIATIVSDERNGNSWGEGNDVCWCCCARLATTKLYESCRGNKREAIKCACIR